jgi:hypothetical protein
LRFIGSLLGHEFWIAAALDWSPAAFLSDSGKRHVW